jgi:hypothetical protein
MQRALRAYPGRMDYGDRLRSRNFGAQPAGPRQEADPEVWAGAAVLAMDWDALVPPGLHKNQAMAALEQAVLWASAAREQG